MSRRGIIMRKGQTASEETKRKMRESWEGRVVSDETRQKMSQARMGKTPWNKDKKGVMPEPWNKGGHHSEETKKKISAKNIGNKKMLGKTMPEEAKKMISEANQGRIPWNKGHEGVQEAWNKGIPHSEETKRKIGDANRGRIVSDETRQKLSESGKGNPSRTGQHASEEERKKMSEAKAGTKNAMYGKHHSEETKRKITEKAIGREISEETRQKMSESSTGENNHEWKGGVTYFPYCHKFNDKLKERIRIRDDHTCQLCNEKQNGRKLDIHHILHDRENCEPLLISLCRKCHGKANHNREYYESFFMDKLKSRGLIE